VELNPLVASPIRDVNDIIVMQTAIIGEADILCDYTNDTLRPNRIDLGVSLLTPAWFQITHRTLHLPVA